MNVAPKITLKAARVNAGYDQKKAAELLGITRKTLISWENGKTFPNARAIERICYVYNTSYDCISFLPAN